MRIIMLLLTGSFMHLSAATFSQTITLKCKDMSLVRVFEAITKQTGYEVGGFSEVLREAKPVTIDARNMPLEDFLKAVLRDQSLTYTIVDKNIIISKIGREKTPNNPSSSGQRQVPFLLAEMRGRIIDSAGNPLQDVGLKITSPDGSRILMQTVSDANGNFTIRTVPEGAVVNINHLGYLGIVLKLTRYGNGVPYVKVISAQNYAGELNRRVIYSLLISPSPSNLVIKLAASTRVLNEVTLVATGYQDISSERATGSFSKIDNKLLNRSVSTDILSRLQGVSGGLLFRAGNSYSMDEDERSNILIRGYSTILSNSQPLIVVDNFPYDGYINRINPNDIADITILKDAAAASIWGARAGNGVIVITTKKGRYGEAPKVSFNANITIREKPDLYYSKILNSSGYIDMESYLFNNGFYDSDITSSLKPALTPAVDILLKQRNGLLSSTEASRQLNELRKIDYRDDLMKYYYRNPVNQQYAINLSGGGENQQYFLSAGYDYNLDNTINNNYKRTTLNAVNTYSIFKKKIEVTTGVWYSQVSSTSPSGQSYSPVSIKYPYEKLADADGNPLEVYKRRKEYIDTVGNGTLMDWHYYPLKELQYTDNKKNGFNIRVSANAKYHITKALSAGIDYLYEKGETETRNHYNIQSYYTRDMINLYYQPNATNKYPVPKGGILDMRQNIYVTQNVRGQLNYDKQWKDKHSLSAIAGYEVRGTNTTGNSVRYYGYDDNTGAVIPVDFVNSYSNYISGSALTIVNNQDIVNLRDRNISLYANAAYTYNNKYTFSLSGRRDGSNLFGTSTNNKWSPFWSAGMSWQIDKEKFYHLEWLPRLKLLASYGYQGNVNKTISALLTISYSGNNKWLEPYGRVLNSPNPDLRWELINQFNLQAVFATKGNIVSGTIEYYKKKGTDLIGEQMLAPSSGFASYKGNTADMIGNGIDISLKTRNLRGELEWTTSLMYSHSTDKVTKYKASVRSIGYYIFGSASLSPIEGKPVSSIFSFKWAGLDNTGDPVGYLNGEETKNYYSISESTDLNEMVYSGPSTPTHYGNMMNTFSWKNLSLSFNISYKFGYFFRRPTVSYNSAYNGNVVSSDFNLRWQTPGDELKTNVPSMIYPADLNRDNFYANSEIIVEKGDHIRLQDIRIDYTLTRDKLKKLPFGSINFYMYASNLGILWRANKYGIDPDYVYFNSYNYTLPGKSLTCGIKIDF
jgi:TonB-linked SusC/RagA family outer membrane protein